MRRRCLGCRRFIPHGSRCFDCDRRRRDRVMIPHAVKVRDGFTCRDCGAFGVPIVAHHVIPLAEGGADTMGNMLTLCAPCHAKRHGRVRHGESSQAR